MNSEGASQDFKLDFDLTDSEAKLDLVKNLVAMANGGGGQIVFGRNETTITGIDQATVQALDSARLADFAEKFTRPARLDISHGHIQVENNRVLLTVSIAASEYPIVMADMGNCASKTNGKTQSIFLKGDIWIRHSSKTERVTYDDIRSWIERARRTERELLLGRINKVIDIPEGSEIQILPPSGVPAIDTPHRMLEYASKRRASKPSYVLPGDDLLELFLHRAELAGNIKDAELSLLLASALRRSTTLYWWLTLADDRPELILDELEACIDAADRDKSDAANSIIEVASIYADNQRLADLKEKLAASRYQHFREVVQNWTGRDAQIAKLRKRIQKAKVQGIMYTDMTLDELEIAANETAIECQTKGSSSAKQLGNLTRMIWNRKSKFASMYTVIP